MLPAGSVIQTVGDPARADPAPDATPSGGVGATNGNGAAGDTRVSGSTADAPVAQTRSRGRPTAAALRAQAQAQAQVQPQPPAQDPADDPLATDDLNGPVDPADDDGDALGLSPPTLSPGEMHAKGLVMSRALFNRGDKKAVKQIQTHMGIAKFTDIPISDGPKLYELAKKLCDQAGIDV